jgi:hypothetical protein
MATMALSRPVKVPKAKAAKMYAVNVNYTEILKIINEIITENMDAKQIPFLN